MSVTGYEWLFATVSVYRWAPASPGCTNPVGDWPATRRTPSVTVTETESASLAGRGSATEEAATEARFHRVCPAVAGSAVALRTRLALSPAARPPTDHSDVPGA